MKYAANIRIRQSFILTAQIIKVKTDERHDRVKTLYIYTLEK